MKGAPSVLLVYVSEGGCPGTLVTSRVICAVNTGVGDAVGMVVTVVCVVFRVVVIVLVVRAAVGETGAGVGVGSGVAGVCDVVVAGNDSDGRGVTPEPAVVDTGVPENEGAPAGFPTLSRAGRDQKIAAITMTTTMPATTAIPAAALPVMTAGGGAGSRVPHWVQNFWERSFVTAPQCGQVVRTMLWCAWNLHMKKDMGDYRASSRTFPILPRSSRLSSTGVSQTRGRREKTLL